MKSFPIESTFNFLAALTIASTVAITSYILIRLVVERPFKIWLYVTGFIFFLPVIVATGSLTSLVNIGILTAFWASATFADRHLQPSQERWDETFFKLASTSFCASFIASISGAIGGVSQLPVQNSESNLSVLDITQVISRLPNFETEGFAIGYLLGSAFSPPVFSIVLWMWKTILLRPGIDRHLKAGETTR